MWWFRNLLLNKKWGLGQQSASQLIRDCDNLTPLGVSLVPSLKRRKRTVTFLLSIQLHASFRLEKNLTKSPVHEEDQLISQRTHNSLTYHIFCFPFGVFGFGFGSGSLSHRIQILSRVPLVSICYVNRVPVKMIKNYREKKVNSTFWTSSYKNF